ncbi:MAG: T9SS type A sorting domain-containing protein [Bacteroidia bacterium]
MNSINLFGQGKNHNWLIGYTSGIDTNVISKRGWLQFDSNNIIVTPDNFKMPFLSAQGNISDENGNLLMVSNGCWIADATLDTMQNGGGLNPNSFTSNWCGTITGIPYWHSNMILPWSGDTTKFVLFHETGDYNVNNSKSSALYYTVIDMTLAGGLGGVPIGQKNLIAINDTLIPGMAACKHANGRDWWIIAFEDSTSNIYKILLTPSGITSITKQTLNVPLHYYDIGQANFSPDGKKFAYHYRDFYNGGLPVTHQIRLYDFDRCNGNFSNGQVISYVDSTYSGNGLAFSSSSKYLYFTTFLKVFQMNTDTSNVQASLQLVAENDTFVSPFYPLITNFWMTYLAANGKMYICSGNSVIDLHYINYPDSGGISCDVQQHALHLPCFSGRGNVYHPNYYLGCDTTLGCPCLITGINNLSPPDFKFRIYPNPVTRNSLNIGYLLPQNQSGLFRIYDVTGKVVFKYPLPQWSNEQSFKLPQLADGVYNAVIISGNQRVSKTIAVIKQ